MNIFQSRKLTDVEFVGNIRKQLQKGKKWAWFWLIASASFLGLAIFFFFLFVNLYNLGNDEGGKHHFDFNDGYRAGFKLGAILGAFGMMLLIKVLWYFYEFLNKLLGNRRDKLLVACYDQLHPFDGNAPAPSNVKMN